MKKLALALLAVATIAPAFAKTHIGFGFNFGVPFYQPATTVFEERPRYAQVIEEDDDVVVVRRRPMMRRTIVHRPVHCYHPRPYFGFGFGSCGPSFNFGF